MPLSLPDQASVRARLTKRSLWRLRYTTGRVVNEWDCDWTLAPVHGRQSLRLYAPNGQMAELGNSDDATGRLFQFKVATVTAGSGRTTNAHVVGIVEKEDGSSRCAAWDYDEEKLITFADNVLHFKRYAVGVLSLDVLGVRLG